MASPPIARRCDLLVRMRRNRELPHCPLANEHDVVHGLDVSSYALVGVSWHRAAVIDLLAVVEHEVDHTGVQEDSSWYALKRRHA